MTATDNAVSLSMVTLVLRIERDGNDDGAIRIHQIDDTRGEVKIVNDGFWNTTIRSQTRIVAWQQVEPVLESLLQIMATEVDADREQLDGWQGHISVKYRDSEIGKLSWMSLSRPLLHQAIMRLALVSVTATEESPE